MSYSLDVEFRPNSPRALTLGRDLKKAEDVGFMLEYEVVKVDLSY